MWYDMSSYKQSIYFCFCFKVSSHSAAQACIEGKTLLYSAQYTDDCYKMGIIWIKL